MGVCSLLANYEFTGRNYCQAEKNRSKTAVFNEFWSYLAIPLGTVQ